MLVDKTKFGLVPYNHGNFYKFEETSSYWSFNEYQFSLLFIGQLATHLRHHSVYPYSDQYRKHCGGHV